MWKERAPRPGNFKSKSRRSTVNDGLAFAVGMKTQVNRMKAATDTYTNRVRAELWGARRSEERASVLECELRL